MACVQLAKVHLLDALYHLDRPFDYRLPQQLAGEVKAGSFVIVPFGGGNRRQTGVVVELHEVEITEKMRSYKPILDVMDDTIRLNDEMLRLCAFLKEHTFCTIGDAVRCILPPSAFSKWEEKYYRTEKEMPFDLIAREMQVLRAVEDGIVTRQNLHAKFGAWVVRILEHLCEIGLLQRETLQKEQNQKTVTRVYLARSQEEILPYIEGEKKLRYPKQIAILQMLLENDGILKEELRQNGLSLSSLKTLCEKGLVKTEEVEQLRNPYVLEGEIDSSRPTLNEEQSDAVSRLDTLYRAPEAKGALLYGVTGSGKTQVIREMIDRVIADGKQVILMVPEIALTPQTLRIFLTYYGDRAAVLHSGLSQGERYDAWRRMKRGEVDLCIGTRSAVFAPFEKLGMIVMDEEQEHTYKSDANPKFHARDVARFRCHAQSALMLLASATPSVESYYKAKQGIYTLVSLKERYGNAVLPDATIIDMQDELRNGNLMPIGKTMKEALCETKVEGNQSILFLNRRGYHAYLSCTDCGEPILCPHCSVSLTHHRVRGSHGSLRCHYCGYRIDVPKVCPSCKKERLAFLGYGTQQVESYLKEALPDQSVLRMDADTTASKFAYDEMIDSFRQGKADVLIGTQMVTKGHDFPRVTLVGVLNADQSLYLNDFRANEKTFSLLTQVIGRAGRAEQYGRALIQTCHPTHPILQLAARQDYESFYQGEISLRKATFFPPFCDIVSFTCGGKVEIELMQFCEAWLSYLKEFLQTDYKDVKVMIYGPMEAPVYKVNDKYRMRFLVKCRANARTRDWIRCALKRAGEMTNKITVSVDVNPSGI